LISADFLNSLLSNSLQSLTKLATPLNQPYFFVPVLSSLEEFHCIEILVHHAINFKIQGGNPKSCKRKWAVGG
jgi:hypothetical protein